jgi:uncharacterized SAM-binding protein YcdF (DUF218 family)
MTRSSQTVNQPDDSARYRVSFSRQLFRLAFLSLLTPVLAVSAGYYLDGKSVAEKVATGVFMPLSIVFFLLIGFGLFAIRNARWSLGLGLLLLGCFVWAITSPLLASRVIDQIESQVESKLPTADNPLDYVVVLGGGTGLTPDLRPQLNGSGDRIILAVQLYHSGAVRNIIVTGSALPGTVHPESEEDPMMNPTAQAKELLVGSNVNEASIFMISGINTSEEMKSLKSKPEFWEGKRCGLITSAFHMPRAIRLAKTQGLDLIPVAADYRANRSKFTIIELMPNSQATGNLEVAIKEFLGSLIGR